MQTKPKTVAEFFSVPGRHCKGVLAKYEKGVPLWHPLLTDSITPTQCCLVGAALYIIGQSCPNDVINKLADAAGLDGLESLIGWNDAPARTQDEILALCVKVGV